MMVEGTAGQPLLPGKTYEWGQRHGRPVCRGRRSAYAGAVVS